MSSEYFFFVAEASAISRALKTMSRGTFFSRASTSTSITSSRFPAAIAFAAATRSSQFRYQLRPIDVFERQPHCLSFQLHAHQPRLGAAQHADKPAPAGRVGRSHPHLGLVPRETGEVARLAQTTVQPRRGNLQSFIVDSLDLQHPGELAAYRRAVLEAYAAGLVDKQAQQPPAVRRLRVDKLKAHPGHHRLHHRIDPGHLRLSRRCKQKMGRSPSFSPLPLKLLKFNRIWQLAPLSRTQIGGQIDRSVAHASEAAYGMPEGLEKSPHLAIASFAQHNAV